MDPSLALYLQPSLSFQGLELMTEAWGLRQVRHNFNLICKFKVISIFLHHALSTGPAGTSVREVSRLTGADIKSWTTRQEAGRSERRTRDTRTFIIEVSPCLSEIYRSELLIHFNSSQTINRLEWCSLAINVQKLASDFAPV